MNLMDFMNPCPVFSRVINFIFPRICIGCWSQWLYLCPTCKKSLHPHPEICPITHKPSPWYAVRQNLLTISSPLDGCIVLFRFEPLIKKLIQQLKYYHRADVSHFLGERLSLALQSHEMFSKSIIHNSKFIISYVPSHRYRHYITKWYNQSKLLAQALVHSLDQFWDKSSLEGRVGRVIPLCRKIKNTHSQVGMSREERKTNLSDAFVLTQPISPWSTILIVDDVLTSGATLIEMSKIIKKSQPDCQVWGLCVARNG